MPPFRCCPDVHKLKLASTDSCDEIDTIANGDYTVMVKETWTTSAGDDGSSLSEVAHGTYACTAMTDIEIPFVSDSWYGRKRRDSDEDPIPDPEGERGWHLLEHTHHAHDYDHHDHGHDHHHHGHDHHHHPHSHHTHEPDPTHPPNVAGKQKTCTLTCPDGEVPANGKTEAICQRVRDGETDQVDKWTQRITKCVPADELLAELKAPTQASPNAPEKTSEANKEASKVVIINTSTTTETEEKGPGHSHKKKKNKGEKKKNKEGKKQKKMNKKQKKEGKKQKKEGKKAKKDKKKKEKALRQEARGVF